MNSVAGTSPFFKISIYACNHLEKCYVRSVREAVSKAGEYYLFTARDLVNLPSPSSNNTYNVRLRWSFYLLK